MKKFLLPLFLLPVLLFGEISLRNNFDYAVKGDYVVTLQNNNYTLLIVKDKVENKVTIEEVTVPDAICNGQWKKWVENGAPGHTSWVLYTIDIPSGKMLTYYNYYYQQWYDMSEANVFLSKLLNLHLEKVAPNKRKKVGASSGKRLWQPPLFVDGKQIPNVPFDAYTTKWPKDGSPLSDRTVLIYLPEESSKYPSYFPYWLQVNGAVGNAQVRIVDSGRQLISPMKVEK